jgi:hypothetical protein
VGTLQGTFRLNTRLFVLAGACVRITSPDYKSVLTSGFSLILGTGPPEVFIARHTLSVLRPNSFFPHWLGRLGLSGGGYVMPWRGWILRGIVSGLALGLFSGL